MDTDEDEDTLLFALLQPLFAEEVVYTLPALEESKSKPFEGTIVFKVSWLPNVLAKDTAVCFGNTA
ncbi:hypothetical protein P5G51_006795 [Virgibacillus sp. 179-BFC.A HS]|uniref:Uncharacterized protein n=1 Tax=Tigheibacillus jepli TaxID=3035914 RepID=A0ABU5CH22_9BACI|nr:hypothetical protein [Virgibacillus sp. 179-BFC.A HS]MDY0405147.1 hypothetical protein [Virgibacillus sp. 179-BFC.A HS]